MGNRRQGGDGLPERNSTARDENRPIMNWQRFAALMEDIRGRWDVAILANLAECTSRPTDLLEAINTQSANGHRLTWKVMRERLGRLEQAGYVGRRDVSRFPRETRYWATDFACLLLRELNALDAWYAANTPSLHPASPLISREMHRE